mmetsp:Transcript_22534/g.57659  ORF Transcript_22534/g.57659 Transcript_22534/m.57659 type:complete len:219 (-) Transcript_22534:149-805(-)
MRSPSFAARALLPVAGLLAARLRAHPVHLSGGGGAAVGRGATVPSGVVSAEHPAPLYLRRPRSACELPVRGGDETSATCQAGAGTFRASEAPMTYANVTFASPLSPDRQVVVEHALVDTGSSDCELREGLLRRLGPLPMIAKGVLYETATGSEAYDVYEVQISVLGRTCVAAVTFVPEERFAYDSEDPCTDEAMLGHVALAAMRLLVDPARGRLLLGH